MSSSTLVTSKGGSRVSVEISSPALPVFSRTCTLARTGAAPNRDAAFAAASDWRRRPTASRALRLAARDRSTHTAQKQINGIGRQ